MCRSAHRAECPAVLSGTAVCCGALAPGCGPAVRRAVGRSLGPPCVLDARSASSAERTPVGGLRPVVRSPAQRSPVGCSAVLPTPLRRAPRSGPAHSSLPDSAPAHSGTSALLPTAPPSSEIRGPSPPLPANRTPALRTPAARALRPAADPPTALRSSALRPSARKSAWQQSRRPQRTVFGDKKACLGIQPAAILSRNLLSKPLGHTGASFSPSSIPAFRCSVRSTGRGGALGRTSDLPRDLRLPSRVLVVRSAARAHGSVRACARVRATVSFVRPPVPSVPLSTRESANSQQRTPRELASGRSRPPGAAPPGGSARER